ncbi:hypothetical protein BCR36DRAFT_353586 [Piromyces finnis]|uniref:Cyclin N-terminal domain-containing protein n=1 Tax=Piromyces finnis TaxID=1754191 RepID=A0A1Y1V9F0_9FUNG|nr:hypothetical protein BCR36DRAFT_353586 [Piromyces finnis]|eukprot:ORX49222.1 hypothetical protein BCR36DRAFT_353586 [Piromyces finnis]
MVYNLSNSIETVFSSETMEEPEMEKEVIVCNDENLMKYIVEVTEILLESIWKSSQIVQPRLCPLHDYLCHVIRQSKMSLYTLKCAIIYFVRISRQLQDKRWKSKIRLFCGRRMFLGSVIIASKYLYDRTYSNSMWAKILGLDIKEVNSIQMDFLEAINYDLFISKELDDIWSQMLENFIAYLKARSEVNKEKCKEQQQYSIEKMNPLTSPLNTPPMKARELNLSYNSIVHPYFPNSPISPGSSLKTLNHPYDLKENIDLWRTSITEKRVDMNTVQSYNRINDDLRRLEEYRPFVKVLIQVIFMYSSKYSLPVGEKRVIELTKLATTPEILFRSSMMSDLNHRYQRPRCISTHKDFNEEKIDQLKKYFHRTFPNQHLIRKTPNYTTGYYSDYSIRNASSFHLYKRRFNYHRVKEANDKICGINHPTIYTVEENDSYYKKHFSYDKYPSSSSSDWDSDSSTLVESSDEESWNLPLYNQQISN